MQCREHKQESDYVHFEAIPLLLDNILTGSSVTVVVSSLQNTHIVTEDFGLPILLGEDNSCLTPMPTGIR
jgi:hypothetical protein